MIISTDDQMLVDEHERKEYMLEGRSIARLPEVAARCPRPLPHRIQLGLRWKRAGSAGLGSPGRRHRRRPSRPGLHLKYRWQVAGKLPEEWRDDFREDEVEEPTQKLGPASSR